MAQPLQPNLSSTGAAIFDNASADRALSLPQVTPFNVNRKGFAPKGASGRRAERNQPIGRPEGPQSCSILPPHNVPGLYLSVVPVSSILIRDPLVSLSNNLTKLASSPRRPGRSASARSRRISTGRLANVASTSRLRRSRAPVNRRGGLVLLLDIVVAAGCLARRWRDA